MIKIEVYLHPYYEITSVRNSIYLMTMLNISIKSKEIYIDFIIESTKFSRVAFIFRSHFGCYL
jgi:hypothetical protein